MNDLEIIRVHLSHGLLVRLITWYCVLEYIETMERRSTRTTSTPAAIAG